MPAESFTERGCSLCKDTRNLVESLVLYRQKFDLRGESDPGRSVVTDQISESLSSTTEEIPYTMIFRGRRDHALDT